jgi:hypothetical protein
VLGSEFKILDSEFFSAYAALFALTKSQPFVANHTRTVESPDSSPHAPDNSSAGARRRRYDDLVAMRLWCSGLIGACAVVACAAAPLRIATGDRDGFLRKVDAALESRNADAILALGDVNAWVASYRPHPSTLTLTLPRAPITRVTAAEEAPTTDDVSQALYQDGTGRRWRLRMRQVADAGWRIVLTGEPCPRAGGMARGLDYQRPAPAARESNVWTPLECWPLPK